MTRAGDPLASLEPETVARLQSHATSIATAATIPFRAREEMIEELTGHLVERTAALIAGGMTEADAAARAIGDFGGVAELSTDLSAAFHSRLWSSTIGVLVPAIAMPGDRPGVVGWMRFALGIGAVLIAVGLIVVLWRETPGRAFVATGVLALALLGVVLAFQALNRGQRWAVWYAIGFAVNLVVSGVISVVAPENPGTTVIPLGAFLGAGILLGAHSAWDRLKAFTAGSVPIGRPLVGLLVASLFAPTTGPVVASIADPTQAASDDLRLLVSVTCDRGEIDEPGFPTVADVQRVRIVADMEWRRGDLLPIGLDGLFNPTSYGDTAGFRVNDRPDGDAYWVLVPREPAVIDVATGDIAGWFGSTAPSVGIIPETIGSFTVGIDLNAIRGDRTLRAEWLLTPGTDGDVPWPTIEAAYAHLDRFLLIASAGCGETAVGRPTPFAVDGEFRVPSDPFGGLLP